MQVPLLDLKTQFESIEQEVMPRIHEVCRSQMCCLGPAVFQFEKQIAQYCSAQNAIGVSSGSDAILISLMAIDIGPGDEVIVPSFTFFATAGAVARLGAVPVFADIDPQTFNIDPASVEQKITPKTKAVIPVDLYGQIAKIKPLMELAEKHNFTVIEDSAQSIGAIQDGKKAGTIGHIGCFSFYPTKNLGAFGDGGMVVTDNADIAQKLKTLRDHGQSPRYHYKLIGGNFRLDGIQGAVLSTKLQHLDQWNSKRQNNAKLYDELLADSPVQTPKIENGNISTYNQYTIKAPDRDKLQKHLAENQIGAAIYYPLGLHMQQCFAELGYKQGDFPETEKACQQVLSLPVAPELNEQQLRYTAQTILDFYN